MPASSESSVATELIAETATTSASRRFETGRRGLIQRLVPIVGLAVVLIAWQIEGTRMNPVLLSTPIRVVQQFVDMVKTGELPKAFVVSIVDLLTGFALAVVVGTAAGIVIGRSLFVRKACDPFLNFFLALPLIATVPLLVVWFGVSFEARVACAFILSVWTIIINTSAGIQSTPRGLLEMANVYQLSERETLRHVVLLNAVPLIFVGWRIGLAKAFVGVVIAEIEVSVVGLGGMMLEYGNHLQTPNVMAALVAMSITAVVLTALLDLARKRLFPWAGHLSGETG